MKILAERLKELRKNCGKNQTQVANSLGLQYFTLGKWEQGRTEPSAEDLVKLADYFNVTVDYLLGREDDFGNIVNNSQKLLSLGNSEREILEIFATLTTEQREFFIQALRGVASK